MLPGRGQAAEIVEIDRGAGDARGKAVEIDVDLWRGGVFFLVVVVFVFFRQAFEVAWRKRVLGRRGQQHRIHAGLAVVCVVPLEEVELRREHPVRQEEELPAARREHRVVFAEHLARDAPRLAGLAVPDIKRTIAVRVFHRIGEPARIRGPRKIVLRKPGIVRHLSLVVSVTVDDEDPGLRIAIGDLAAVRREHRAV